ncbi:MAG: tripartite tricarboxylate transporter TctB family protein [Desulfobacteraceae bacterium]|jgi:hypothetical protein
MAGQSEPESRLHDLFGAFLGALAAGLLISTPWQVDTTGPDPFYKGPLIYPLLVLSLMVLASLPSAWRLARPPERATWVLDEGKFPLKPSVVFVCLIGFLFGLVIIGLSASSLIFMVGTLYYVGHRRLSVIVLVPMIVTGLVFMVFKFFLDVYFPTPLLVEWLGG